MKMSEEMAIRLHLMMWGDMQKALGDNPKWNTRSEFKKESGKHPDVPISIHIEAIKEKAGEQGFKEGRDHTKNKIKEFLNKEGLA